MNLNLTWIKGIVQGEFPLPNKEKNLQLKFQWYIFSWPIAKKSSKPYELKVILRWIPLLTPPFCGSLPQPQQEGHSQHTMLSTSPCVVSFVFRAVSCDQKIRWNSITTCWLMNIYNTCLTKNGKQTATKTYSTLGVLGSFWTINILWYIIYVYIYIYQNLGTLKILEETHVSWVGIIKDMFHGNPSNP